MHTALELLIIGEKLRNLSHNSSYIDHIAKKDEEVEVARERRFDISMAPSKEACAVAMAMAAPFLAMASNIGGNVEKRRRTSIDALQRTVSDVSYELHHHVGAKGTTMMEEEQAAAAAAAEPQQQLHPVAEVEDARCECCGMSEECTPEYIREVRGRFSGRWVCGLCAEAVTEEADKNGGEREEALRAHMAVCKRFNGFGRTHPVLFQAEAMREILRKRSKLGPRSRSSIDAREVRQGAASNAAAAASGGIARSSSCMPFITDESSHRVNIN